MAIPGGIPATFYLPGPAPEFGLPFPEPPGAGNGPPAVLLVHGYTTDRVTMSVLARRLANAGYGVLAIDVRGHGQNARPLRARRRGREPVRRPVGRGGLAARVVVGGRHAARRGRPLDGRERRAALRRARRRRGRGDPDLGRRVAARPAAPAERALHLCRSRSEEHPRRGGEHRRAALGRRRRRGRLVRRPRRGARRRDARQRPHHDPVVRGRGARDDRVARREPRHRERRRAGSGGAARAAGAARGRAAALHARGHRARAGLRRARVAGARGGPLGGARRPRARAAGGAPARLGGAARRVRRPRRGRRARRAAVRRRPPALRRAWS